MDKRKIRIIVSLFFILFTLSACINGSGKIRIRDAKIATGVDENLLMPVKVTDSFPKGTSQVFCWFQWKDAKVDTEILAKWHYVTDDIRILDYTFKIPRKEGSGSISLSMPEGKILPSGSYRLDLTTGKNILKSLSFKIQD